MLKWLFIPLGLAAALAGAALLWLHMHDTKVVQQSDAQRTVQALPALDTAAQDRAIDAVANITAANAREAAITTADATEAAKPPEDRATLPPTTLALNCARLRRAYSAAQLAKIPAYQEHCR